MSEQMSPVTELYLPLDEAVSAIGVVLTLVALPEPKGQTLESAAAETSLDLAGAAAPIG